jgi:hypothetical protein
VILPHLDERQLLLLGAEARSLGYGGIRLVARAAGVREGTVSLGVDELESGVEPLRRVRRPGGGRKRAADLDPGLLPALLALVEPDERGDPMPPLRWTTKPARRLAAELAAQGHAVSADTAAGLLRAEGFSLQANVKTVEGKQHPDRDAQFRYISGQASACQGAGDPGDQRGRQEEGARRGVPERRPAVAARGPAGGRAGARLPRGQPRQGGALRHLRHRRGHGLGERRHVCHFPPGTSKWNKIEHRLFSHITMNWRGRPLTSHEVVVQTIAATTTGTGLRVHAELDPGTCDTGVQVSDAQMDALPLDRHDWHGDWNYTLHPREHGDWEYGIRPRGHGRPAGDPDPFDQPSPARPWPGSAIPR